MDRHGTKPLPEKVRALRELPAPKATDELRRFLGMLNFYHVFVPHIAGICTPLTDLLAGKKKHAALYWKEEHQQSFDAAMNALADATLLIYPVAGVTVDACLFAVGGALEQLINSLSVSSARSYDFVTTRGNTPPSTASFSAPILRSAIADIFLKDVLSLSSPIKTC